MSDEKKKEITEEDVKRAVVAETVAFLREKQAEIVKRAHQRLKETMKELSELAGEAEKKDA